jgi:hypothetical protein
VYVLRQRETDRAALGSSIDGLAAAGGTSLYDAILKSLDSARARGGRDVRCCVFSDGDDQSSLSSADPVERRVRSSDAVAYFITLGGSGDGRVC